MRAKQVACLILRLSFSFFTPTAPAFQSIMHQMTLVALVEGGVCIKRMDGRADGRTDRMGYRTGRGHVRHDCSHFRIRVLARLFLTSSCLLWIDPADLSGEKLSRTDLSLDRLGAKYHGYNLVGVFFFRLLAIHLFFFAEEGGPSRIRLSRLFIPLTSFDTPISAPSCCLFQYRSNVGALRYGSLEGVLFSSLEFRSDL